jgi:transcriptional regulator with XRE-family HTH domain
MTAAPGESPAVARRRVRLALRKARVASALSQSDVAQRLGWSMSKVQRIESGDVTVSGTDLRALLDLYGGFSDEEVERLAEDARISRRQRWWTAPEYREHLTSGLMQLLQFEAEATAIRVYQPVLIPGPLQTSSFAEIVLNWWSGQLSDQDRQVRHGVRMMRRAQVIEREDAPTYYLILDQSALEREIGGPKVMAEQLEALIDSSRRTNVRVRIVPYREGALIGGTFGPFTVLDLSEDDRDDAVVYRESYNTDSVLHDRKDVRFHREIFERLWQQSWSEELSLRAITAKASDLRFQVHISETVT